MSSLMLVVINVGNISYALRIKFVTNFKLLQAANVVSNAGSIVLPFFFEALVTLIASSAENGDGEILFRLPESVYNPCWKISSSAATETVLFRIPVTDSTKVS